MPRKSTYKPLLFTTTIRNPERLKSFVSILKEYDGKTLTSNLAEEIAGEVIRNGLYTPTKLSTSIKIKFKTNEQLTQDEVLKILIENPQNHKEAGFSKGWPSRFDTWFKFAKELGFVYYNSEAPIKFSTIGLMLVNNEHPEFEQQAFLNSFVKYQSNNPFRRVLNENIPLILLLNVITLINKDSKYNDSGITKLELPLIIYWKDNNYRNLYLRIKKLRDDYGFSPSWEVITHICQVEIMNGEDITRNHKSIMVDYPDEFIRKMRLTGLITIRGGGRFIDINKLEQKKVDYVLLRYSTYKKFDDEIKYFEYISQIDDKLIQKTSKPVSSLKQDEYLTKWVSVYSWASIKTELNHVIKRQLTKDLILRFLSFPVRLEFLTALAIKSRFPTVRVIPNYPVDDEGLPTATAPGVGDTGDIECIEELNGILIEVTMAEGTMQTRMEIWPISRHLSKFSEKSSNSMCYFIAPSIFSDSKKQIDFVLMTEKLRIIPKTIDEFIKHLEFSSKLYLEESESTT